MPMYEFICEECGQDFEELLRNAEAQEDLCCPTCASPQVKRKMSRIALRTAGGFDPRWSTAGPVSSCGTSRGGA